MTESQFSDTKIIQSWRNNARAWTDAVRNGQIESRRQVTDRAIVDVILGLSPRTVLDIGCGEGWLARALGARGIETTGIDVVPDLVEDARRAGGGDFHVMSYEEIAAGKLAVRVDTVVCNFSLLGKESVEGLFRTIPALLNSSGAFIVQTLHPVAACGDLPYRDGWRSGSWDGFGPDFTDPAPWYFRTLESWKGLFADNGYYSHEMREPAYPQTGQPASVIFIGEPESYRKELKGPGSFII